MRIPLFYAVSAALLLSGLSCLAQPLDASAPPNTADTAAVEAIAKDAVFTEEQLDQMLAPIALYPDPLLAQVLMATTYPGEVAEAVTWSKAHPDTKGDDAVKQVASQPWDPSVQALVAFPQVLATLGQDPVWVQRLGDAFLAQPDDVMGGVQRLRHQAQAAGNLQSNQYQNVTVQAVAAPAPTSAAPASPLPATTLRSSFSPPTRRWSTYPVTTRPPPTAPGPTLRRLPCTIHRRPPITPARHCWLGWRSVLAWRSLARCGVSVTGTITTLTSTSIATTPSTATIKSPIIRTNGSTTPFTAMAFPIETAGAANATANN